MDALPKLWVRRADVMTFHMLLWGILLIVGYALALAVHSRSLLVVFSGPAPIKTSKPEHRTRRERERERERERLDSTSANSRKLYRTVAIKDCEGGTLWEVAAWRACVGRMDFDSVLLLCHEMWKDLKSWICFFHDMLSESHCQLASTPFSLLLFWEIATCQ